MFFQHKRCSLPSSCSIRQRSPRPSRIRHLASASAVSAMCNPRHSGACPAASIVHANRNRPETEPRRKRTEMTFSIYALVDPRDSKTRYIGQTCNPKRRFHDHCSDLRKQARRPFKAWLAELKGAGLKPVMVVMQQNILTRAESVGAETYWIRHFVELGAPLFNLVGRVRKPRPKVNNTWASHLKRSRAAFRMHALRRAKWDVDHPTNGKT